MAPSDQTINEHLRKQFSPKSFKDVITNSNGNGDDLLFILETLCRTIKSNQSTELREPLEGTLERHQALIQELPSILKDLSAGAPEADIALTLTEGCSHFETDIFEEFIDSVLNALHENDNFGELKARIAKIRENIDAPRPKLCAGYRTEGAVCDFRDVSVLPTLEDLKERTPYLRPNVTEGAYASITDYLDIQFRLLREDLVAPLRVGVQRYRKVAQERKKGLIRGSLRSIDDVHFFTGVRIDKEASRRCSLNPDQRVFRLAFRDWTNIDWEHSSRLMNGSLIGVSSDDFSTVLFATVAQRVPNLLQRGFVVLQFLDETAYYVLDPMATYTLIESSSAYFEAYRYNLQVIQSMEESQLPLTSYLVNADKEVRTPDFLRARNGNFDFSPLRRPDIELPLDEVDSPAEIKSTDWPAQEQTVLNVRQYEALRSAFSRELCLVQGPPGTGKTFVALKMIEMILLNCLTTKPILIVCYTNHALDQFLEGILKFTDKIVRIGGNCKSAKLEPYTLRALRKSQKNAASVIEAELETSKSILKTFRITETLLGKLSGKIILEDTELKLSPDASLEDFLGVKKLVEMFRKSKRLEPVGRDKQDLNSLSGQDCREIVADGYTDYKDILEIDMDSEREKAIQEILGRSDSVRPPEHEIVKIRRRLEVNKGNDLHYSDRWKLYRHYHWLIVEGLARSYLARCGTCVTSNAELVSAARAHQALTANAGQEVTATIECLRERAKELRDSHRQQLLRIEEAQCATTFNIIKQCCSVVGMTTTGAAKYNKLVRQLQPQIVVVEEAAEILEAHLLASLTPSLKQLILIGDHQQIQPSTTVHTLGTKFGMQVSMFERLVKNKLTYVQLQEQHRMRDPFRQLLVPTIYKDYISHYSVFDYPNTRGMGSNLFFMRHSHLELSNRETHSKSNQFEAQFVARLALHLRQQGYAPEEVTILATYRGQVGAIESAINDLNKVNGFSAMEDKQTTVWDEGRRITTTDRVKKSPDLPMTPFEGVRITTVDNYQGEESRIIILSLVRSNVSSKIGFLSRDNRTCVAISRAKIGLFAVGNLSLLASVSSTWEKLCAILEEKECIGDGIELKCEMHSKALVVKEPVDFDKFPQGGCGAICGTELPCGHVCPALCHGADPSHEAEFRCSRPCGQLLDCGHQCARTCAEDCSICVVPVPTRLDCGHLIEAECSMPIDALECNNPCERAQPCKHPCPLPCGKPCGPCQTEIRVLPRCGHTVTVKCKDRTKAVAKCTTPVDKMLPCGHFLQSPCSENVSHQKCTQLRSVTCSRGHNFDAICFEVSSHGEPDNSCSKAVRVRLNCGHYFKGRCSTIEWCDMAKGCRTCNAGHVCSLAMRRLKCKEIDKEILDCGHQLARQCSLANGPAKCTAEVVLVRNDRRIMVPCDGVSLAAIPQKSLTTTLLKVNGDFDTQRLPTLLKAQINSMGQTYTPEITSVSVPPGQILCNSAMTCGHKCASTVPSSGRCATHQCFQECGKTLFCGHRCASSCHTQCSPCCEPVHYECPHGKKTVPCMISLYTTQCMHPAVHCVHVACQNTCSSCTCRCDEKCQKELKCGGPSHRCVGLCGESCICVICDATSLSRTSRHPFSGVTNGDTRYLRLACGHCCEVMSLDQRVESNTDLLKFPTCPFCESQVRFCRRYRVQLAAVANRIIRLVQKVFGNLKGNERSFEKLISANKANRGNGNILPALLALLGDVQLSTYHLEYIKCMAQVFQMEDLNSWSVFHDQSLVDCARKYGMHMSGPHCNVTLPEKPLSVDGWNICSRGHFYQRKCCLKCEKTRRSRLNRTR
ncbi:NFX1-type zinc finger-containing protein 1-like [Tropilaelaps mercedesae]|uniref:NFX1-type zinc finger-containing protein 1-like n=1 Tax=Tropilaelaps mercedesae TaxID=418985 RepID=A0A1V9Y2P5_9ACAR|nr:NFX1-type zinc finger-containing protein 1-like [Tropilaelaps mercedesae]